MQATDGRKRLPFHEPRIKAMPENVTRLATNNNDSLSGSRSSSRHSSITSKMTTSGPNELATDVDASLAYTNRVLSQAEGAGTDFYTINFARYACADVHVCPDGQRIYNSALLNAPRFACRDDNLQFGLGDRHYLRNAGVQLYEYEHLLLASALSEFFSEDYAAAVFNELADFFEDDDRPKPRLSAFKGFVRSSNGLLATSGFPLAVDDRIRLNPYADHDRGMPHATTTTEFVPIGKVALAIRMLGKLKKGEVDSLTFVGGDVIGWFSAFIEIFLGISQTLVDESGKILYKSNGQTISVTLKYVSLGVTAQEGDPLVIWLRKPLNINKRSDAIPPILTGRVVGEALFSKVFGPAFHTLDQTEAKAFANALGAIARAGELTAKGELIFTGIQLRNFMSAENVADPKSWGIGLIQTWTNWFPELRHLQGRMERALKLTQEQAGQACEDTILRLEPLCGCYICSNTQGSEDNPTNLPKQDFCIPTMMETIIMLGMSLSRVVLIPDLFPSRAGILSMYKTQVYKRLRVKKNEGDRFTILFGEDWNQTASKRLQNIITLFSGSKPTLDLADNLMALSHEGVCAYVSKLQRGDKAAPHEDDNLIRVVTGQINWRQKTYSRLTVGCVKPPVDLGEGWESFKSEHFSERIYVK